MAAWGQKYPQSTTTLSPCGNSFFHMHVGVVNLKGGCCSFSYSAAQQCFSVHLNHVHIVLAVGAIPSQSGHYGMALDLWMYSNNSPSLSCFVQKIKMFVTSDGFLHSSSNVLKWWIFGCTKGDEFLERIRYNWESGAAHFFFKAHSWTAYSLTGVDLVHSLGHSLSVAGSLVAWSQ